MKLFKTKTLEDHQYNLAAYLPRGLAFTSAQDITTNFGKFINGLAGEICRTYKALNDLSEDYDILSTSELLPQWESSLGIPDNCFPATGTNAERRLHVLIKFAKMNVQTIAQMQALAVSLGFTDAIVRPYNESLLPYDVPFTPVASLGMPDSRYYIVITAANAVVATPPYDVPFTPTANNSTLLTCVFNIVRPANCQVIYKNV